MMSTSERTTVLTMPQAPALFNPGQRLSIFRLLPGHASLTYNTPRLILPASMTLSRLGMFRDQMNSQGKMAKKKSQALDHAEKQLLAPEFRPHAREGDGCTSDPDMDRLDLDIEESWRPQRVPCCSHRRGLIPQHDDERDRCPCGNNNEGP